MKTKLNSKKSNKDCYDLYLKNRRSVLDHDDMGTQSLPDICVSSPPFYSILTIDRVSNSVT